MPNDILFDLQASGYLARTSHLADLGHSHRAISCAVADGRLLRICDNWVATRDASQTAIIAILHRGKLTGATALASYGIWNGLDRRIHVRVPRNCHGPVRTPKTPLSRFTPPRYQTAGVCRHWVNEQAVDRTGHPWRVSVIDALVRVAHDGSDEQFLASVESALYKHELSLAGIPLLFALLPHRLQSLRESIEPIAESGLETLARLRLAKFVRSIQPQVPIAGIGKDGRPGRVDLLLDGWLVIELDGDEFHDPVADRKRDVELVRRGYRVHRFGYEQIIHAWADVEATIRELLRYSPTALLH